MPQLIIFAGPNGGGKTTLARTLMPEYMDALPNITIVNPDDIALEIYGGYDEDKFVNAAKLAENIRENAIQSGRDLAFETVYSTQGKPDFLKKAKELGYNVHMNYISTNHPKINASRIMVRVMQGGHSVPMEKIYTRYFRSLATLARNLNVIDTLQLYDNSYDGQDYRLLATLKNGQFTKNIETLPDWAEIIESCHADGGQNTNAIERKISALANQKPGP